MMNLLKSRIMDYVIIPLEENGKKPLLNNWSIQTKSPLAAFKNNCNCGILCGKVNKIIVVDVDIKDGKKEVAEKFMNTFKLHELCNYIVKTTSNGFHFYFKYIEKISGSCKPKFDDISCIDIQSNGTQVVMEGSIVNSKKYECVKGSIEQINEMPELLVEFITTWTTRTKERITRIKNGTDMKDIIYNPEITLTDETIEVLKNMLNTKALKDMAINYSDWSLMTGIFKKYGLKQIWDEWSKTCKNKYNSDNNNLLWKKCDVKSINADLSYIQFIYNINYNDHVEIIETPLYEKITIEPKTITINRQYLPSYKDNYFYIDKEMKDILKNKCILIKANMGAGKTTLINEYMKDNKTKFLSIVSRISLSIAQYNTFSKNSNKYSLYTDKKTNYNNLITTCDSLPNFTLEELKNRIVYLDEISSMLHYITTADHIKTPKEIFTALKYVLKNAQQIIATDADLNDAVFKFFDFCEIDYVFVNNTFKYVTNTIHHSFDNHSIFWDTYEKMSKEKKTIFCSDSKSKVDVATKILIDLGIKDDDIIIITSDKTPLDKEKKLIDTNNWNDKYILYSPSVIYGVDFQPNSKMNVFYYCHGLTLNPIQITQQIFRCRKIDNIYTYVDANIKKPTFNNYQEANNYYQMILNEKQWIDNIIGSTYFDSLETDLNNTIFNSLYIYHKLQDNITSSNFYKYIVKFLEDKGIKTILHKSLIKKKKDDKEKYDNKKELVEDAQKTLEKILVEDATQDIKQNNEQIFNPIVKRMELLGFLSYDKKTSEEYIKKYDAIIHDDKEFKKHIITKYCLDLFEKPENISKRFACALKKSYAVKVNESIIGKFELLRKLKYNASIDKKEDFEKLRTLCRLSPEKYKQYDDTFLYKVLINLGVDCIDNKQESINKKRQRIYFFIDEKLNNHRELIKITENAPKKNKKHQEIDIFDIFEIA